MQALASFLTPRCASKVCLCTHTETHGRTTPSRVHGLHLSGEGATVQWSGRLGCSLGREEEAGGQLGGLWSFVTLVQLFFCPSASPAFLPPPSPFPFLLSRLPFLSTSLSFSPFRLLSSSCAPG